MSKKGSRKESVLRELFVLTGYALCESSRLSKEEKHYFFELREALSAEEWKLLDKKERAKYDVLKDFHEHLKDLTDPSTYRGGNSISGEGKKKYDKALAGMRSYMEDPKKLAAVVNALKDQGENAVDSLDASMYYISVTFGLNCDFEAARELSEKTFSELAPEAEKKQIINDSEVIKEMHDKPAAADDEFVRSANAAEKKQIINDSEVINEKYDKPAAADDELVRFANIEVNVERAIETHAPDLNARHRVSFIGGGKSKELRNVEDAADAYRRYMKAPDDPQFKGKSETDMLEALQEAADKYIEEKKKGRWGNTDDPN